MAPRFPDQAETANNRDAESDLNKPASIPMGNSNGLQVTGTAAPGEGDDMVGPYRRSEWLRMTQNFKSAAEQNLNPLRNIWANNYRAGNNQHAAGSKYTTERYRGRSQLHRPKTRTAVKKSDAGAANALFATSDVVSIEATNPNDPKQVASAAINKALLNYRLDRKSGKAGVPWFQVAVGAHNDTLYTGICVSKQYWERREVQTKEMEDVPMLDEATGQPMLAPYVDPTTGITELDPTTGQPVMAPMISRQPKMKIVRDRPMIRLFRPELVLRDPGADWLDQAQESGYIGLMHMTTIGDLEAMMNDPQTKVQNMKFIKVDRSILMGARVGSATTAVTTARESSGTPQREEASTGIQEFDRIWIIEWFVRVQGIEYVYWTAGSVALISEIRPVEEAYPEQKGERPIVIGLGNIEPHKIDPMSMVQSVLPMQAEMNDLVNLRMDGVKDGVRPLAMVKKGKNIDVKAIQHRSGDSAIYVTDKDDVSFDRPGSIGGEAYTEMNMLNVDFDDAVGQFNGGSVSTNRNLNETVGGLKLLNSNANVVGDFDLRVWIETYVEPTLRQVVNLEQYYEDDKVILTIAGEKAKLYQKYGINVIDDELLERECSVTVNAGIGNTDPMVKLDKFAKAAGVTGSVLGQSAQDRIKQDPVIDEIFGAAGFRDASERFFHPGDMQDPRITKMKDVIQTMQAQLTDQTAERENDVKITNIESAVKIVLQLMSDAAQQQQVQTQAVEGAKMAGITHAHDTRKTQMLGDQKNSQIEAQGKFKTNGAGKPSAKSAAKPSPEAQKVDSQANGLAQLLIKSLVPDLMPEGAGAPMAAGSPAGGGDQMAPMMQMMQQMGQAIAALAQKVDAMGGGGQQQMPQEQPAMPMQ